MPSPSKSSIRAESRQSRSAFASESRAAASAEIVSKLVGIDVVRSARNWFVYASAGSEVETHELIEKLLAMNSVVAVPRIVGENDMIPRQIHSLDELQLGEFGILAPPGGEAFAGAIDVCACPGVAFTERGERLGSGRGFYDRYLAAHPPRLAIGLAFECQVVAELPVELHDRRMDFVITEKRVINCREGR